MTTPATTTMDLPTTLGDERDSIAVDQKRVRQVNDGGLAALWVPIVARNPNVLQEPEAKTLALRWAARVHRIEGGLVKTQGPVPDDGTTDPTVFADSTSASADGRSASADYLQMAAAMNTGVARANKGYVLFCLVRANEASY